MKELYVYETDLNLKTMKKFCHGSFGSVTKLLINRELGNTKGPNLALLKFAEEKAATSEMQETYCQLPSSVRSTFLMSFSPDCSKVASTHGDHKIYICDVKTGKLLHKLEGHPRTPWCLQFHPTSNDIVASGCLGGEVRVWDLHGGSEIWNAPQATVITSLTFHPFDKVLVIATQNELHFWNWSESEPFAVCKTKLTKEKVRFVKFDSLGNKLITGISNINNNQSSNGENPCYTPNMPAVPPLSPTTSATFPRLAAVISPANSSSAIRSAMNRANLLNQPVALRRKIYVRTHRPLSLNRPNTTLRQPEVESHGAFRPTMASESAIVNTPHGAPEQSNLVNNSGESQSTSGVKSSETPQLTIVKTGNWELQSSALSTPAATSSSMSTPISLPIEDPFPFSTFSGVGGAVTHSPAPLQSQSSVESRPLSAPPSSPALPYSSLSSSSSTRASSSTLQSSSTQSLLDSYAQFSSLLSSSIQSSLTSRSSSDDRPSTSLPSTLPTAQPSSGIINSNLPINRRTLLSRLMNMYRQVEVFQEMERNEGSFRSHSPTESDALHRARNYARAKTTQASHSHSTMERIQDPSRSQSPIESQHPAGSSTQAMAQTTHFRNAIQRGHSMLMPFKKRFKDSQNLKQSRASKLQCKPSTSTNSGENHDADSRSNDSSEDSDNNNDDEEIGEALEHIENLCESLEIMLRNPQNPYSSLRTSERSAQVASWVRRNQSSFTEFPEERAAGESDSDRNLNRQPTSETSRRPNANRHADSGRWYNMLGCLECVLTRSQHYLQIAAIRNTIASEQIRQVRFRLTEILECMTNLATYRAHVKNFYRRAIEGSYQHRPSDASQHEYMDLSHCIWLLELCVQLCREMQIYFQGNSRPAPLQTTSLSASASLENNNIVTVSEQQSATSSSSQNMTSQRRIANLLHLPPSQLAGVSSFSPLSLRFRETLTQLHNNRNQLMQVSREIDRLRDNLDDLNQPTSSQGRGSNVPSGPNRPGQRNAAPTASQRVLPRFLYTLDTDTDPLPASARLNRVICLSSRLPRRRMELPRPTRYLGITVPSSVSAHSSSSSEHHGRSAHPLNSSESSLNVAGRARFYIPEVHIESSSNSSDEGPLPASERPRSPPLSAILQGIDELTGMGSMSSYTAMVFEAGSRLGIHEGTISFTHRIQLWDFSKYELPDIGIEDHNVIVPRCKIHNDASVDISKDGEVLVALVPSRPTGIEPLIFGVYSLRPGSLGLCLCTWGFESNAISVSLSPLGQYVVVGLARPYVSSPEKEAVAQIFKLRPVGTFYNTVHIRSLTQLINNENRYPQVSLNSVQWLPQPGQGLIYGTNRGCLCISKPRAPMTLKKSKLFFQNSLMQSSSISLGLNLGVNSRNSEVSTMSTQTTHPSTQTTGTQTFSSENTTSAGR